MIFSRFLFLTIIFISILALFHAPETSFDSRTKSTDPDNPSQDNSNSSHYAYKKVPMVTQPSPDQLLVFIWHVRMTNHTQASQYSPARTRRLLNTTLYTPDKRERHIDQTGMIFRHLLPRHVLASWSQWKESFDQASLSFKLIKRFLIASRNQSRKFFDHARLLLRLINRFLISSWNQSRESFDHVRLLLKLINRYLVTTWNQWRAFWKTHFKPLLYDFDLNDQLFHTAKLDTPQHYDPAEITEARSCELAPSVVRK